MTSPSSLSAVTKVIASLAVVLTICGSSFGQEANRPDRGSTLNRNYLMSDIEKINLQNGNVQLSIPLASLPPIAGGKLTGAFSLNYNSKLWDVLRYQEEEAALEWAPYVVDMPGWGGGWSLGGGYGIQFRNANDDFYRLWYDGNSGLPQWELDLLNNYQWWKIVLLMPDGSEHELRPLDHGSYAGSQDFLKGYYNVIPTGTAKRYYSGDGSYLFARISNSLDWTVYLPDGTRIIQTPDGVQRIQDTNGNKIKMFSDGNGGHIQDEQTGREIRMTYDPAANGGQGQYRVWYPRVGGGTEHYIEINMGTTTVQGKTYTVNDWEWEEPCQSTAGLYSQLPVVREIIFPQTEPGQQRKFVFEYNSDDTQNVTTSVNWTCNGGYVNYTRMASVGWGELSRVISPPGTLQDSAYADYSYQLDGEHSLFFATDELASNSITSKVLTHDGIADTWSYGIIDSFSSFQGPDGNWLSEQRFCSQVGVPGCSIYKSGSPIEPRFPSCGRNDIGPI